MLILAVTYCNRNLTLALWIDNRAAVGCSLRSIIFIFVNGVVAVHEQLAPIRVMVLLLVLNPVVHLGAAQT